MRVAVVLDTFPKLSESFVVQHVLGLLEAGVDVRLFARQPAADEPCDASADRRNLLQRTVYRSRSWHATETRQLLRRAAARPKALARALRRPHRAATRTALDLLGHGPFDVVHVHFGHVARELAALLDAPLVTTFHGYDANVFPRQRGPSVYRELFRRGAAFTVNSEFLRRRLLELGAPGPRLHVVPMGVDLSAWLFTPRHFVPGQTLRLVSVARLVPAKGLDVALHAVAQLAARGHHLEYTVIGAGPLHAELERTARQLGISSQVRWLGALSADRVQAALADQHLFVLPSVRTAAGDEEAQGLVVQEAAASGLPVIVSDVGGLAEGLVPDESGLVVPAGDAAALARAIERLLAAPERWPQLGERGRALVETKFALPAMTRAFLDLYERVRDEAPPAWP